MRNLIDGHFSYPADYAMGMLGIRICSIEVGRQHSHLLDHFVGQYVFNLLPNPGTPNNLTHATIITTIIAMQVASTKNIA